MTPEEHDTCVAALRERTLASLQELARGFNVQDPPEDRAALVEQLVPVLVFDERMQNLRAFFDHGEDVLLAVKESDAQGAEVFGWLVGIERETGCLVLAPVERGAPETVRIALDWSMAWRRCVPPSVRGMEFDLGI